LLTISKPLSAGQAQTYHAKEFTAAEQNYWKQGGGNEGEWHGKLAEQYGLAGAAVGAKEFSRLSEGQHPETGERLVRHRKVAEYSTEAGKTVAPVEHRAGWDATFSAPKSVSLTALVGGDDRVRIAHREAVDVALNELERYTYARIGGNNPPEHTGKFIAAKFEHDTARPVDGYVAPQLHTHVVVFNLTERADGSTRALQERALFESQQFATAIYQAHLTCQLRNLGYELETGKSGAPEIKGYSREYLDASSPRRQQIEEALARSGKTGAEASEIAAHTTRDKKAVRTPEEDPGGSPSVGSRVREPGQARGPGSTRACPWT
jgi:conjugative relaxase-like TrwC/TraI family protein